MWFLLQKLPAAEGEEQDCVGMPTGTFVDEDSAKVEEIISRIGTLMKITVAGVAAVIL